MKSRCTVVKLGGAVIDDLHARELALQAIAKLSGAVVIIHGGGKIATELAGRMGIETTMIEGRRVTDAATLELVTMTYAGLINKQLVADCQKQGINVLGLSGVDADLIRAHKRVNAQHDFGFVGDIDQVNAAVLKQFMDAGLVPLVAPITHDGMGQLLNTNADTIASRVALALQEFYDVQLLLCFDKAGVLLDLHDESSMLEEIKPDQYEDLKAKGVIHKGMIAKLDNAFEAVRQGVQVCLCSYADLQKGTRVLVE